MGEAKRRKKLDPSFGKPVAVVEERCYTPDYWSLKRPDQEDVMKLALSEVMIFASGLRLPDDPFLNFLRGLGPLEYPSQLYFCEFQSLVRSALSKNGVMDLDWSIEASMLKPEFSARFRKEFSFPGDPCPDREIEDAWESTLSDCWLLAGVIRLLAWARGLCSPPPVQDFDMIHFDSLFWDAYLYSLDFDLLSEDVEDFKSRHLKGFLQEG